MSGILGLANNESGVIGPPSGTVVQTVTKKVNGSTQSSNQQSFQEM